MHLFWEGFFPKASTKAQCKRRPLLKSLYRGAPNRNIFWGWNETCKLNESYCIDVLLFKNSSLGGCLIYLLSFLYFHLIFPCFYLFSIFLILTIFQSSFCFCCSVVTHWLKNQTILAFFDQKKSYCFNFDLKSHLF